MITVEESAAAYRRASEQVQNIYIIDPMEAYNIAMAYTRVFARLVAAGCDTEEEYKERMVDLATLMYREGKQARIASGNPWK